MKSTLGHCMNENKLKSLVVFRTTRILLNDFDTREPPCTYPSISVTDSMNCIKKLQAELVVLLGGLCEARAKSLQFTREFGPHATPGLYWETVVQKIVDPIVLCFKRSVHSLAESYIETARTDRINFLKHSFPTNSALTRFVLRRVLQYTDIDPPWESQYMSRIDQHLHDIESFMWCHFAEWRATHSYQI